MAEIVRLRAGGPIDLAPVRSLGARLFASRGDYGAALGALFRTRGVSLVVAEGPELCGFVMYGHGQVLAIGVEAGRRRAGVGRALLRRALAALDGEVRLEVARDADAARALFASEGFREVPGAGGVYANGVPYDTLARPC